MDPETLNSSFKLFLAENPGIIILLIWIVICKAFALWYSARRGQKIWFVALLIVNTMGILEVGYLIYIYFKNRKDSK